MQTYKKTVEIIDNFKIKAYAHSWHVDQAGYDAPEYYATFRDQDTNDEFILPVNKDFMNQLEAGANQTIEMEIRFLERK